MRDKRVPQPMGCYAPVVLPLLLLAVIVGIGGCNGEDVSGLLERIGAYTADVSVGMAARGWTGFPANPIALAMYTRDLASAIREAGEGAGDGGCDGDRVRRAADDVAAAFGVAGHRGER